MKDKRFLIHIGIMIICLLVLVMAILMTPGESPSVKVAPVPDVFQVLSEGLGPEEGTVPFYQVLAEGRRPDGSPLQMVYYQYSITTIGEKACALDMQVRETPHPGYTPLLCESNGTFFIRIPIYGMKLLKPTFCGNKCAECELIYPLNSSQDL